MKLIIDWGNSRVKLGLFNPSNFMVKDFNFSHSEAENEIINVINNPEITGGILCAVAEVPAHVIDTIQSKPSFIIFSKNTPLPILNAYETPETLGLDRLAAVVAASKINPNRHNLVISVGTALVYNFITQNNAFRGGAISPGINMRLKAMHDYAYNLPLIKPEPGIPSLIGYNTSSSLESGAINGVLHEIDGTIDAYNNHFSDVITTITGGDSSLFAGKLKNKIFADPFLVLKGLNIIYEYNSK